MRIINIKKPYKKYKYLTIYNGVIYLVLTGRQYIPKGDGVMILFASITVAVEKEGDIYRAYAYRRNEENIAIAKSFDSGLAISSLFEQLRVIALESEAETRGSK